jgi:hypothetical protein
LPHPLRRKAPGHLYRPAALRALYDKRLIRRFGRVEHTGESAILAQCLHDVSSYPLGSLFFDFGNKSVNININIISIYIILLKNQNLD